VCVSLCLRACMCQSVTERLKGNAAERIHCMF